MCYFSTTYNMQYYLQNRKILTSKKYAFSNFSSCLIEQCRKQIPYSNAAYYQFKKYYSKLNIIKTLVQTLRLNPS